MELAWLLFLLPGVCLAAPSVVKAPRCYDCHYLPGGLVRLPNGTYSSQAGYGGFHRCALKELSDPNNVDQWRCASGKCFVRQDHNGLVYRGCADQWNLPWGVTASTEHNCMNQGSKGSLWWFCDGDLCNDGDIGADDRCGTEEQQTDTSATFYDPGNEAEPEPEPEPEPYVEPVQEYAAPAPVPPPGPAPGHSPDPAPYTRDIEYVDETVYGEQYWGQVDQKGSDPVLSNSKTVEYYDSGKSSASDVANSDGYHKSYDGQARYDTHYKSELPVKSHKSHEPYKSHEPQKSHVPYKSHEPQKSHVPYKSHEPQKSHAPYKSHEPQKSHVPYKSHEPQKSHVPYKSHEPQKSHVPYKSHEPQKSQVPYKSQAPQKSDGPYKTHEPQKSPGPYKSRMPQKTYVPYKSHEPKKSQGPYKTQEPQKSPQPQKRPAPYKSRQPEKSYAPRKGQDYDTSKAYEPEKSHQSPKSPPPMRTPLVQGKDPVPGKGQFVNYFIPQKSPWQFPQIKKHFPPSKPQVSKHYKSSSSNSKSGPSYGMKSPSKTSKSASFEKSAPKSSKSFQPSYKSAPPYYKSHQKSQMSQPPAKSSKEATYRDPYSYGPGDQSYEAPSYGQGHETPSYGQGYEAPSYGQGGESQGAAVWQGGAGAVQEDYRPADDNYRSLSPSHRVYAGILPHEDTIPEAREKEEEEYVTYFIFPDAENGYRAGSVGGEAAEEGAPAVSGNPGGRDQNAGGYAPQGGYEDNSNGDEYYYTYDSTDPGPNSAGDVTNGRSRDSEGYGYGTSSYVPDSYSAQYHARNIAEAFDYDYIRYERPAGYYADGHNPCDGKCDSNPSNLFPDPARSNGFIQCGAGIDGGKTCTCCKPYYQRCPAGTTFDVNAKVCSQLGDSTHEERVYQPVDLGKADHEY